MPLDSPLVERARQLARTAHAEQVRKASGVPYFTHLDAVAMLLDQHGHGDDTSLAAAYLHDLIEDQPHAQAQLRREMPAEVVEVVEALTEQKLDSAGKKRPKADRFADYVSGLSGCSKVQLQAIPISCADRIHNTQSIIEDERRGYSALMALTTRPGELLRQLGVLRALYEPVVNLPLLGAFDQAASCLASTIDCWLLGRAALIAAEAHLGQFDEAGEPLIVHAMRLALAASNREARIVALLYQGLSNSRITLDQLEREGFCRQTLRALQHLVPKPDEHDVAFVERLGRQRLAAEVKLLDLAYKSSTAEPRQANSDNARRIAKYRAASARLQAELDKRSLQVVLDASSRARVREHATLPVFKGDHVTLAHRVHPDSLEPTWIPGGHAIGARVALRATEIVRHPDVEVLVIEIDGETRRPYDGGTLHLTISRSETSRSSEANRLVNAGPRLPFLLELHGNVRWVDG